MTSCQIPAGSLMHSTVVGSNVLLSSIRPFGSQRPSTNNVENVQVIGAESGNHLSLKKSNDRTPEVSARQKEENLVL